MACFGISLGLSFIAMYFGDSLGDIRPGTFGVGLFFLGFILVTIPTSFLNSIISRIAFSMGYSTVEVLRHSIDHR